MFLKDHLKDTYQKASFDKNHSILENTVNKWAHRFGIESLDELIEENQEQINLKEEYQGEENQEQINLKEEYQEEENQEQINLKEEYQEEKNQEQINLKEEYQEEKNQNHVNLELLENVQSQVEIDFKSNETKIFNNNGLTSKDIYESNKNKSEYVDMEKLPLPNINNLRKWIKNEKKAS